MADQNLASPCCNWNVPSLCCFNYNAVLQHLGLIPVIFAVWWCGMSGPAWTAMSVLWLLCCITSIILGYVYCCCGYIQEDASEKHCLKQSATFHFVYSGVLVLAIIVMGSTIEQATEEQCSLEIDCMAGSHRYLGCGIDTKALLCSYPTESRGRGSALVAHFISDCEDNGGDDRTCWVFNSKEECANEPRNWGRDDSSVCREMTFKDMNTIAFVCMMSGMLVLLTGTLGYGICGACRRSDEGSAMNQVHPSVVPVAAATTPVPATAVNTVPVQAYAVPAKGVQID